MNMKDLKPKLQKIYHWLKERPCTHVVAIALNIVLLCLFAFLIYIHIDNNIHPEFADNDFANVIIFGLILLGGEIVAILLFIITFMGELITSFKLKVIDKYLLENKIYNIFWFIGSSCFLIILCIIGYLYLSDHFPH